MFLGASKVTLDAKGRMAIPTRHRQALKDSCDGQLMLTIDRDYCLLVFPLPAWEVVERKLVRLSSMNRHTRRLQRLMLGHATEVEMDGHGRILISRELREFARLNRTAVLTGQGNMFELWDEERWVTKRDEWLNESQGEGDDLPSELESLSF